MLLKEKNCCLFSDSYETHIYTMRKVRRISHC